MNLPKFPHSDMFVGCTNVGKTEYLLRILETEYKNHFEFIVILCPMILDNKTYLSSKWILDDKNVSIVCDAEGKLNEWIRLFKDRLKGRQTLFVIDDCSAEGETKCVSGGFLGFSTKISEYVRYCRFSRIHII